MTRFVLAWLEAAIAPENRKPSYTPREIAEIDQALVSAGGSADLLPKAGGESAIASALTAAGLLDALEFIAGQDDRTIAESDSGAYLRDLARAAVARAAGKC